MSNKQKIVLLPIQSKWLRMIMEGKKSAEFRSYDPKWNVGDVLFFVETGKGPNPRMIPAIGLVWETELTPFDHPKITEIGGSKGKYAIHIKAVLLLDEPWPLSEFSKTTPQKYKYLKDLKEKHLAAVEELLASEGINPCPVCDSKYSTVLYKKDHCGYCQVFKNIRGRLPNPHIDHINQVIGIPDLLTEEAIDEITRQARLMEVE